MLRPVDATPRTHGKDSSDAIRAIERMARTPRTARNEVTADFFPKEDKHISPYDGTEGKHISPYNGTERGCC